MDAPKVTAKDFFLWTGAMLALYAGAFSLLGLLFDYINRAFPDPLEYLSADPYQGGVSYEMASVIVLTPLALALMLAIARGIARDPSRAEVWVRRWALYLTLFVAGATLVADLITLIMYFLQGELTVRFLLKVAVVFLVAGGAFLHFLADLRGYWIANPRKCHLVAWGVGVLSLVAVVSGFFIVGTPMSARLYRFDERKVNDLQGIQSQIISYWQAKQALPKELGDVQDSISGYVVPLDPQNNRPYGYRTTGVRSFELCATFNKESGDAPSVRPIYPQGGIGEVWQHEAGETCFSRAIDPSRYPPLRKSTE